MLISRAHNFIFIHIYKTGGTSVSNALRPHADRFPVDDVIGRIVSAWTRHIGGLPPALLRRSQRFPSHIDTQTLRNRISARQFSNSYKFAFVRNPWDWQVSLFHFGRMSNSHMAAQYRSLDGFEEYIRWRLERGQRSQKSFLADENGEVAVDFVGRFETLNADFKKVCKKIGVKARLPHANASKRGLYQDYYTPEMRDAIGELFQEDIEEFAYSFDDVND